MEWLKGELNIQTYEDWYRVTFSEIRALRGYYLLVLNKGLIPLLKKVYPDYPWKASSTPTVSKIQLGMWNAIMSLFPNEQVHFNYNAEVFWSNTKKRMEFDLYAPRISLALEYQGEQHYKDNLMGISQVTF